MTLPNEPTPSTRDDSKSAVADVDTSFEIDEAEDEDEETALDGHSTPTNNTEYVFKANFEFSGGAVGGMGKEAEHRPVVEIRDDPEDQSDSSIASHSSSSTPTTADVADISAATIFPSAAGKARQVSHVQTAAGILAQKACGALVDDNLSTSISTTLTDIDLDNVASSSPRVVCQLSMPQSHHHHLKPHPLSAHPSAAFRETDAATGQGADGPSTSSNRHKRTQSASSYRSTTSQHSVHTANTTISLEPRMRFYNWIRWICVRFKSSGIGEPSVHHALVVIFLEFFAWGLLTMPVIAVLNQTFPDHTFLMNGLVMGIKGILSFLSAPLIGALSDIWGRKFFLLITVFFTCAPIPLMTINTWWFFAMISISGIFAVTFSVVFAYVADVTTVEERSRAYGLVSATFAASLVISPALGAALMEKYSDTLVVALATAIAVLDVFFILVAVPESLPDKVRPSSWGAPINWEQADPFAALRKVGTDHTILMQCVTVLLSYLPEAGQYSCIFVYLKLKMGFNTMEVAIFIAVVGILSIGVQVTLGFLMRKVGAKRTIILGLILEMLQLLWYGFGSQKWMMWAAGILAALGSITYPAISAFVSIHSTADSQGAVQGMVTGMRGLCNGLGPAMFGVVFYLFNVDLNNEKALNASIAANGTLEGKWSDIVPGPPFLFGALMVILAILVAVFIPEVRGEINFNRSQIEKKLSFL